MTLSTDQYVIAALALAEREFGMVQIQKFFFILDQHGKKRGDPAFFPDYTAQDYGPYSAELPRLLSRLREVGFVQICQCQGLKLYSLTIKGVRAGDRLSPEIQEPVRDYIRLLGSWVSERSFKELVTAVLHEWPEMAAQVTFPRMAPDLMKTHAFRKLVRTNFAELGEPYCGRPLSCVCRCPLGIVNLEGPQRPIPSAASETTRMPYYYCLGVVAGWDLMPSQISADVVSLMKPESKIEFKHGLAFGRVLRKRWLKEASP